MTRRQQSTPEQLEAAILAGAPLAPCRYIYAAEVWPEASLDRWPETVPPHAVIHALRRDRDHYHELLLEERTEVARLRAELAEIRGAVRTLHDAVDLAALFDVEAR